MRKDYGKIRYPIHILKDEEDVVQAFPDLAAVPIFSAKSHDFVMTVYDEKNNPSREVVSVGLNGLDNNFVMKYIILMYSPNSPSVEKYPQIGKRKAWVMSELGVELNEDGNYDDKYLDLLLNQNRLITKKIATFLTIQQPADWAILLKSQEDLQEILSIPMPEDPTKQVQRVKAVELLRQAIHDSKSRLMDLENSKKIEDEIDEFVSHTTLGIRPEEFVMMGVKNVAPSKARNSPVYKDVSN